MVHFISDRRTKRSCQNVRVKCMCAVSSESSLHLRPSVRMSPGAALNTEATKDRSGLLPRLESLDRMLKLPVVDATWQRTQSVYGRVKGYSNLLAWAFGTAEGVLQRAVSISAPLVHKFDRPLHMVDQTLVKGIDKLEENAPIIKEQPEQIYNQARTRVLDSVKPYTERVSELRSASHRKVSSLKDISWKKANEVLASQYGSIAINGVDATAQLAERLLDYFIPKDVRDGEEDDAPIPISEDPVLHTVQTVGRLSNKISRRVYQVITQHIKTLRKEDVREYVATLIAALGLAQYLNSLADNQPMDEVDANSADRAAAVVLDAVKEAVKDSKPTKEKP
ncbi:lipid storage droplets surface-binding protein 2-like [Toxorhynchites rutilus septentrionalis]|uniref:lipid storage droplets surface-binding protein 2-like n=1 Tax=Toxorhynchites rutilus septentrionalis TaxID=329112 RepID=UPI0024799664|nr:lipid storage droplets surface-binding protein 2-like [Toxorhynchites rutilus septentrionalis]